MIKHIEGITKKFRINKRLVVFCGLFALIGITFLLITRASSLTSSFEAEHASLSGGATIGYDQKASNGQYVQFGGGDEFVHPGVLVSQEALNFVKEKIQSPENNSWKISLNQARDKEARKTADRSHQSSAERKYGSLEYKPWAVADVKCDHNHAVSEQGCWELLNDSQVAYTQALLYAYTGDTRHADKAIEILNAWSSTLNKIYYDSSGRNYLNGKLFTTWSVGVQVRAAEIVRHTYNGWSNQDIAKYELMLKNKFLPLLSADFNFFNWDGSFADSQISIGVFTNDREIFNNGVNYWRQHLKQQMYLSSEPDSIVGSQYNWHGITKYVDGIHQETCRDFNHTMMGLSGYINAAETAYIQGVDLYGEEQKRLVASYELHSGYVNEYLNYTKGAINVEPVEGWMPSTNWHCPEFYDKKRTPKTTPQNGAPNGGGTTTTLGWEIAYNHYVNRKNIAMPKTTNTLNRIRLKSVGAGQHQVWERLTHDGAP